MRQVWLFNFHVFLLIIIDIFQLFFNNFLGKLCIIFLFTVIPLILMRLEQQLTILRTVKQRFIKAHVMASRFDFTLHFLLVNFTLADLIYYVLYYLLFHDNYLFHLFDDLALDVDWNLHDLLDSLDTGIVRCDYCNWLLGLIFVVLVLVALAVVFNHIELILLDGIVDWRLLDWDAFSFWKGLYLG